MSDQTDDDIADSFISTVNVTMCRADTWTPCLEVMLESYGGDVALFRLTLSDFWDLVDVADMIEGVGDSVDVVLDFDEPPTNTGADPDGGEAFEDDDIPF